MSKKLTHEEFIQRLDKSNPDRTYSIIGIYQGYSKPLLIKNEHGNCMMTPCSLVGGNNPDIRSAINKTEYVKSRFRVVHGDTYIYDLVEYIKDKIRKCW